MLLRFNYASILSQGSIFYELLMHTKKLLEETLVIKYTPPGPEFVDPGSSLAKRPRVEHISGLGEMHGICASALLPFMLIL